MVDCSFDDTISNSFSNDIFSLFFRVCLELDANISDRDSRVCQGDGAEGGLENEMTESEDEEVVVVCGEGGVVGSEGFLEGSHVPDSDS